MRNFLILFVIVLLIVLFLSCGSSDKSQNVDTRSLSAELEFSEKIVAGGPSDFMEVRYIMLRGSNYEIGKKLAEIASARFESCPIPYPYQDKTEAQLRYFGKNYPSFMERMRGVAAAFEKELQDVSWNFAALYYGFTLPGSGCSSVFYPPNTTKDSRGVLSRNFDFTTGTINGKKPKEGELSACARPYIIEIHPSVGYASLVVCSFDLLGGALDGINSEGLTMAIHSDNDVIEEVGMNPAPGPQEGFNEIQIIRYILDTCRDVQEAKEALRQAKLYYNIAPFHYIIADRHGGSFIWENSPTMDRAYAIDGHNAPLVTTNFLLHRYQDPEQLPGDKFSFGWFNRFREIRQRIVQHKGKFDKAFIKETNQCVAMEFPIPPEFVNIMEAPTRTLWHALYYPELLRVELDFYLGEEVDPSAPNGLKIRRSGYHVFSLKR
ncbi:MAG: linear amide C-N hydrolase [Candidatus Aminicenantes bacterium]|nr:linear amide C-N hydrolase [Candidatus Aminicenantes bacterium]